MAADGRVDGVNVQYGFEKKKRAPSSQQTCWWASQISFFPRNVVEADIPDGDERPSEIKIKVDNQAWGHSVRMLTHTLQMELDVVTTHEESERCQDGGLSATATFNPLHLTQMGMAMKADRHDQSDSKVNKNKSASKHGHVSKTLLAEGTTSTFHFPTSDVVSQTISFEYWHGPNGDDWADIAENVAVQDGMICKLMKARVPPPAMATTKAPPLEIASRVNSREPTAASEPFTSTSGGSNMAGHIEVGRPAPSAFGEGDSPSASASGMHQFPRTLSSKGFRRAPSFGADGTEETAHSATDETLSSTRQQEPIQAPQQECGFATSTPRKLRKPKKKKGVCSMTQL